jgi:hypothetical protein
MNIIKTLIEMCDPESNGIFSFFPLVVLAGMAFCFFLAADITVNKYILIKNLMV